MCCWYDRAFATCRPSVSIVWLSRVAVKNSWVRLLVAFHRGIRASGSLVLEQNWNPRDATLKEWEREKKVLSHDLPSQSLNRKANLFCTVWFQSPNLECKWDDRVNNFWNQNVFWFNRRGRGGWVVLLTLEWNFQCFRSSDLLKGN